jgi:hypothetical protein
MAQRYQFRKAAGRCAVDLPSHCPRPCGIALTASMPKWLIGRYLVHLGIRWHSPGWECWWRSFSSASSLCGGNGAGGRM